MKTKILFITIAFVLFSLCGYSQIDVPRVEIIRTSGAEQNPKGIYAVIKSPLDGSSFAKQFEVNGIAKNIPADHHIWLVVSPRESIAWWPQFREVAVDRSSGKWNGRVEIGGDEGKLIDIVLVSANKEAHNDFVKYVLNQKKDNYPEYAPPLGAKSLAHITVVKELGNSYPGDSVNLYYGFSKTGVFYIHKSLIEQAGGKKPCLVAGVTNWTNNVEMTLDHEYYYYEAKIDEPFDINLEYCFYVGNGNYIPQLLIEKSSRFIKKADYKSNSTKDGTNFYTSPQDSFPNIKN